ncbi:MAG: TIGR00289 family protein, partial [Candidatus Diapherotrites archaeon]|nr:TIGR00289 family protein [Candidatus Diapherotrites archaeon]
WHREQAALMMEMLRSKFSIMVAAVAAHGLDEKWLGRMIDEKAVQELVELQKKFSVNPAGEGGELETLVLDCPLFKKKIQVLESEKRWDSVRGELVIKKVELVGK